MILGQSLKRFSWVVASYISIDNETHFFLV